MPAPETNYCSRPLPMKAETSSGVRTISVPCGSRIAHKCAYCAHQFLLRVRTVFYSALTPSPRLFNADGTLTAAVNHLAGYSVFFVTATAPSFGPVHNRPKAAPHICSSCGTAHAADSDILGYPVNPATYKFEESVAWNRAVPDLLRNTFQRLRRAEIDDVQYCGVYEIQTRGALHFHGLVAVKSDLPADDVQALLRSCFSAQPDNPRPVSVKTLLPSYRALWGAQCDIQQLYDDVPEPSIADDSVNSKADSAVRYISKCLNYTTKQHDDLDNPEQKPSLMMRKMTENASDFYIEHGLKLPANDEAFVGANVKGLQRSRGWGLSLTALHELTLGQYADAETNFDRETAKYQRITYDEYRSSEAQTRAYVQDDEVYNEASSFPVSPNENSWFSADEIPDFIPESTDSVEPLTVGQITLTDEQTAVVNSALNNAVTVVSSGAGTGKTTTISILSKLIFDSDKTAVFSSLTNAAVSAFRSALPGASEVFRLKILSETLHSLAWDDIFPDLNAVYEDRLEKIDLMPYLAEYPADFLGHLADRYRVSDVHAADHFATAEQICSFALHALNRFCASADDSVSASHVRCPSPLVPAVLAVTEQLAADAIFNVRESSAYLSSFATLLKRYCMFGTIPERDFLILDEAQDLPPCVAQFVNRFVDSDPFRHVIIIGDLYQNLFGFAGASSELFAVPAVRLALTKSHRFPQNIADDANRYLPDSAPKLVSAWPSDYDVPAIASSSLADFDAVLCVTNHRARQLVADALYLGLAVTSTAYSDTVLSHLQELRQLPVESRADFVESKADESDFADWQTALTLSYDVVFMHLVPSARADLTVSTVHRAKGREWDRVLLTNEIFDERNSDACRYVAHSRARLGHARQPLTERKPGSRMGVFTSNSAELKGEEYAC